MLGLDGDELVDDVCTIFQQMLLESICLQVLPGCSAYGVGPQGRGGLMHSQGKGGMAVLDKHRFH